MLCPNSRISHNSHTSTQRYPQAPKKNAARACKHTPNAAHSFLGLKPRNQIYYMLLTQLIRAQDPYLDMLYAAYAAN